MIDRLHRDPLLGYGFALGAFGIAVLVRIAIETWLPPGFPYLSFFPAVILTAYVAGTRPGILCAVLCGIVAWYRFIPPYMTFGLTAPKAVALGFYVLVVGIDVWIIHGMRDANERFRREKDLSAALAGQQATMFSELQHRVANNLAFVSALLALKKKRIVAHPESAPAVMDEAIHRLELMGRIHRRLYSPEALDQDTGDYLRGLCADLLEATGARNIVCLVDADRTRLDITRLTALSMLVTELMTNSLKHAFNGRAGGTISIDLKRIGDRLALTVGDDGPGMPPMAEARPSLGLTIIRSLAQQLGGELSLPGPGQSATRLVFAAS